MEEDKNNVIKSEDGESEHEGGVVQNKVVHTEVVMTSIKIEPPSFMSDK